MLDLDLQVWTEFLKQNWLVIVVALVVLFLILNFVKTVVKWALVLVIAGAVIIYSGITLKDLSNVGQVVGSVTGQAMDKSKEAALEMMKKEATEAKLKKNADGTFTITTPNLEVTGSEGADKVKVSFQGISLGEWKVSDTLEAFIQEAKRNSK